VTREVLEYSGVFRKRAVGARIVHDNWETAGGRRALVTCRRALIQHSSNCTPPQKFADANGKRGILGNLGRSQVVAVQQAA
jgi:hypothetical protein